MLISPCLLSHPHTPFSSQLQREAERAGLAKESSFFSQPWCVVAPMNNPHWDPLVTPPCPALRDSAAPASAKPKQGEELRGRTRKKIPIFQGKWDFSKETEHPGVVAEGLCLQVTPSCLYQLLCNLVLPSEPDGIMDFFKLITRKRRFTPRRRNIVPAFYSCICLCNPWSRCAVGGINNEG